MNGPRIGSLCTGVGAMDLGVMDAIGGTVVWHSQYEPPDKDGKPDKNQYAARILEHRFPGVPNHGDIKAIDWSAVEPIDVLTAGYPCQPFSLAGLLQGVGNRGTSGRSSPQPWAPCARRSSCSRTSPTT